MTTVWATTASTTPVPVVNALNAACEAGIVPDRLELLSNPTVTDQVDPICDRAETVVEAYGGDGLTTSVTTVEEETDFAGIVDHYRTTIEGAGEEDAVAVDVTPGRKFTSAIAFQAGLQFGADHVLYLLVASRRYYDLLYPEIPRSALELIDFTEELR